MNNKVNRWGTSIALLAFFSIIALAGKQSQSLTATSVLVTNASNQPVPVTASATQPVPIRDASHGKDGLQMYRFGYLNNGSNFANLNIPAIPGERFVITNVSAQSTSQTPNDAAASLTLEVTTGSTNLSNWVLPLNTMPLNATTTYVNQPVLMYLDPGQSLFISFTRLNTYNADSATAAVTVSGYRVSYP